MAKYYQVGLREYIDPESNQPYYRYRIPRSITWVSWTGTLDDLEKKLLNEANGELLSWTKKPIELYARVVFNLEASWPGIWL